MQHRNHQARGSGCCWCTWQVRSKSTSRASQITYGYCMTLALKVELVIIIQPGFLTINHRNNFMCLWHNNWRISSAKRYCTDAARLRATLGHRAAAGSKVSLTPVWQNPLFLDSRLFFCYSEVFILHTSRLNIQVTKRWVWEDSREEWGWWLESSLI